MCAQTLNVSRKLKTTEYTVEDLEPDVEYEFRVSAENSVGTSEPTVSSPVKYGPLVVQLHAVYCVLLCVVCMLADRFVTQ